MSRASTPFAALLFALIAVAYASAFLPSSALAAGTSPPPGAGATPDEKALAQLGRIARSLYAPIRDAATEIRRAYPPETHVYIGVGRSPSGILAFLEASGLPNVVQLPLTNAHALEFEPLADAEMQKHLARTLAAALASGKEPVLIDYTQSGATLRYVRDQLNRYLRRNHPAVRAKAVAIYDARGGSAASSLIANGFHPIGVNDMNLADTFGENGFRDWSKHPEHPLWHRIAAAEPGAAIPAADVSVRPEYRRIVDTFRDEIARDPSLRAGAPASAATAARAVTAFGEPMAAAPAPGRVLATAQARTVNADPNPPPPAREAGAPIRRSIPADAFVTTSKADCNPGFGRLFRDFLGRFKK